MQGELSEVLSIKTQEYGMFKVTSREFNSVVNQLRTEGCAT